jgi:hypothetical protein
MLIRDPVIASKVALWREKEANGTLTIEEANEIVIALRQGRTAASEASRASKVRSAKPVQSAEEMLNEIDNL